MTAPANAWPQEKLDALWELQKLARKAGNRVVVVADLIYVTKSGGETQSFATVIEAATWHGGAP